MSDYVWTEYKVNEGFRYLSVNTDQCMVTLEPRPYYCDRGRYIAKVFPHVHSNLILSLDAADGWPRYYYDKQRAIAEIEAWLSFRQYQNQTVREGT